MKKKSLLIGIVLLLISLGLFIHARMYIHVDENNVLRESLSTPLSVIFFFLGIVFVVIELIKYLLKIKK